MENTFDNLIILKFTNAGIFKKDWAKNSVSRNKDDRILSDFEYKDGIPSVNRGFRSYRTEKEWINQTVGTIHYSFIEQSIRVLCGMRPKSKYRFSCIESNEEINNISKRAYVKIQSFIDKKNGKSFYVTEKTTTTKSLDNSWGNASPSWIRMKYLLPKDLYDDLVNVSRSIIGDGFENLLFDKISDILASSNDSRVDDLIKRAEQCKCKPLAHLLSGSKTHSLYQAGYNGLGAYLKTLVTRGVSDISRLDGEIYVPVTNDELKMFKNGDGTSSLFEGGLVYVNQVIDLRCENLDLIISGALPVEL